MDRIWLFQKHLKLPNKRLYNVQKPCFSSKTKIVKSEMLPITAYFILFLAKSASAVIGSNWVEPPNLGAEKYNKTSNLSWGEFSLKNLRFLNKVKLELSFTSAYAGLLANNPESLQYKYG